ncbi:MAG: hypothetical protein V8Q42_13670 [Anaerovoracaceae bacterium]
MRTSVCDLLIGDILSHREDSTAAVPVVAEKVLVPGGQSVGVKMDVRGVLVVGLEEISLRATVKGESGASERGFR